MCGVLQGLNVAYFTLEAVYQLSGSVWVVAALVTWEGLLGGAAYVRTFYCISTKVARAAAPPLRIACNKGVSTSFGLS